MTRALSRCATTSSCRPHVDPKQRNSFSTKDMRRDYIVQFQNVYITETVPPYFKHTNFVTPPGFRSERIQIYRPCESDF